MGLFSPIVADHLRRVAHYAKGRLLDAGCGQKPYREIFAAVDEYVGLDRPSEVDARRPDVMERQATIDVVGEVDAMPFDAASFDTVLSTQVLEHLARPQRFFAEAGI